MQCEKILHKFDAKASPTIIAALAENFGAFFSSSKLMYMKNEQYKHVLGSLFYLERNKYCSTLTINIESSLIHSMNIFIWLQANIY